MGTSATVHLIRRKLDKMLVAIAQPAQQLRHETVEKGGMAHVLLTTIDISRRDEVNNTMGLGSLNCDGECGFEFVFGAAWSGRIATKTGYGMTGFAESPTQHGAK